VVIAGDADWSPYARQVTVNQLLDVARHGSGPNVGEALAGECWECGRVI